MTFLVPGIHLSGRRYYGKINFSSNGNTHRIAPGSDEIPFIILVNDDNINRIRLTLRIPRNRHLVSAIYRTSRWEIANIDTAVRGYDWDCCRS